MDVLQPTHLIFILVVALLVLGPKRLPEVGRSLGKGIRDFRGAMSGLTEPDDGASPPETSSQVTPVTPATTTLPTEDSPESPTYTEQPTVAQPAVAQPTGFGETASGDEQTGSALLPHVEPDEPAATSPAAGPSRQS